MPRCAANVADLIMPLGIRPWLQEPMRLRPLTRVVAVNVRDDFEMTPVSSASPMVVAVLTRDGFESDTHQPQSVANDVLLDLLQKVEVRLPKECARLIHQDPRIHLCVRSCDFRVLTLHGQALCQPLQNLQRENSTGNCPHRMPWYEIQQ